MKFFLINVKKCVFFSKVGEERSLFFLLYLILYIIRTLKEKNKNP